MGVLVSSLLGFILGCIVQVFQKKGIGWGTLQLLHSCRGEVIEVAPPRLSKLRSVGGYTPVGVSTLYLLRK